MAKGDRYIGLQTYHFLVPIVLKSGSLNFLETSRPAKACIGIALPFNTLNAELNPICYLLALLGAHHFLHVSRIRVKLLTLRPLMSYIYIYIWSTYS